MSFRVLVTGLALALSTGSVMTKAQTPPPAPRPKPTGVADDSLKIPSEKLEPIATFEIPGAPDWMAIDEHVWISNSPKNNVTRIDPKTNKIVANIDVGKRPCSGLVAGFGSLWV